MKRNFKYYLKINETQKQKLNRILEFCCWLYNYLLEQFCKRDENKQGQLTEFELINTVIEIKKNNLFLKEVYSTILQEVAKRVYKVWQNYKKLKRLDPKKKYPKFKKIHRYNSFTYIHPITHPKGCGYKLDNSSLKKKKEIRKLKLSLGRQNYRNVHLVLKLVLERNLQGDAKTLTIKRKNNRYYALFSCENIPLKPLPKTNKKVGIDANLKKSSYLTLSNGKKYKHPKHYKKSEKELKKANQNLSRKEKGSQNWWDAKLQLNKKWEKVKNQFKHYSYQIANELVKDYDKIAIEGLKIKKMMKKKPKDGKRKLRQSLQNAKFGILFQSIAEAAEIATRQFIRVNPYNTSQICSGCGELTKEKIKLNQRIFKCWNCKNELDRDINSARNILNLAEMGSTRTFLERGKYLLK